MPFHSTFMTTLCNGSYYYLSLGKVRSTAINSPGSQMMSLSFIPRESDSRFHDLTTGHILLSSFSPKKMWLLLDVPSMVSIVTQCKAQLVPQTVKRLLKMWETRVQSLGLEDLLEKEMATHSSILAWKIPWMEEPGRLQFMRSQRVGHN